MTRKPDPDFDALVEVTNANIASDRGGLNTALKAIKHAWHDEGGRPEDLAAEIPLRAAAYRKLWPSMSLTPTALAVHWKRVMAEQVNQQQGSRKIIDDMKEGA